MEKQEVALTPSYVRTSTRVRNITFTELRSHLACWPKGIRVESGSQGGDVPMLTPILNWSRFTHCSNGSQLSPSPIKSFRASVSP